MSDWDSPPDTDPAPKNPDEDAASTEKVLKALATAAAITNKALNPDPEREKTVGIFLARLKELVGEDIYNANPQIEKFARSAHALSEDTALQSSVTLMLIAMRDYAVSDEFYRFAVSAAMKTFLWSARREMLIAVANDIEKGRDVMDPEYWVRANAWCRDGLEPEMQQFMQCMSALDGLPPRDDPRASMMQQ